MTNVESEPAPDPAEHMTATFLRITGPLIAGAEREIELARAQGDRAALEKAQVRLSTLTTAREIYNASFKLAHGRPAWPRP